MFLGSRAIRTSGRTGVTESAEDPIGLHIPPQIDPGSEIDCYGVGPASATSARSRAYEVKPASSTSATRETPHTQLAAYHRHYTEKGYHSADTLNGDARAFPELEG